jgi:hypothetical protein
MPLGAAETGIFTSADEKLLEIPMPDPIPMAIGRQPTSAVPGEHVLHSGTC